MVETHDESLQEPSFDAVPYPLGCVAKDGLEEQCKAHPLVVGVVLFGLSVVVRHAWMSHFRADLTEESVGHGERRRDPAVSVNWPNGQIFHYAMNRIADELIRRYDERTRQKKHGGEQVVQSENSVIRDNFLPL